MTIPREWDVSEAGGLDDYTVIEEGSQPHLDMEEWRQHTAYIAQAIRQAPRAYDILRRLVEARSADKPYLYDRLADEARAVLASLSERVEEDQG